MNVTLTYAAAPGAPYNAEQAQLVGEALEAMEARGVPVAPSEIVEEARPASSILHPFFTWEDREAAEAYRRWEARSLVNHLRIVVGDGETIAFAKARYSVRLEMPEEEGEPEEGEEEAAAVRAYVPLLRVQSEPLLKAQKEAQAVGELRAWRDRWMPLGFDSLARVFALVDKMAK